MADKEGLATMKRGYWSGQIRLSGVSRPACSDLLIFKTVPKKEDPIALGAF
ncbi:hypothetical protein AA0312_0700 [Acetobacter tropicalis NRIC 0312]|uniref:Uncharacterized protein n=1 Tax=Acetobacter tropicalis TaxID=104102 RepID=A0A511FPG3_9PROT|nr:hypothetical protein ATR1_070c0038 [Acetobacter tropicalis]GBR67998.1 hypothetical protein AA0312_0700 [Acetobacter tropicalis NRIC 0312]GEL50843.1 hypothetical protein ATR01nite_19180 [Acetobacter tropicalis]